MTRRRTILLPASVTVALVSLAMAGCGGSDSYSSPASANPPRSSGSAQLRVGNSGVGRVLVDAKGRTLYLFEKDTSTESMCSGACATAWPPFTTGGKPRAGAGIIAAKIATTQRSDGAQQVTYNGHPLYTFAGDQQPGDTNGDGVTEFGAEWYAVTPAGQPSA